jgi:branched-chain amino acid transport system substrate-binding protein
MTRNLLILGLALSALALAGIAVASTTGTPGVSSNEITIGSSGPLTGEAAAAAGVLRGADAYFKYVNNARGGVNGRKITFKYLDDAYDPSRTVQNVRQLIQQDNVFALFSVVGTNGNLAVRDFTNAAGVPQVYSAAGATTFGRDYAKYPWTIGYLPPYSEEGELYARHILAVDGKKAKIAVLYQSDDYGKDLLSGFRRGLGTKRKQIVQTVGYDPTTSDVQSQVAQLKASGANTFAIFAFGKFAIQSFVYANKLGWKPQIYVNDVASASSIMKLNPQSTAEGAISVLWGKDPATPKFAKDAGVALAAKIIKRYVPGGNPSDGFLVAGMAEAFTFVDALRQAGKNLTRKGLMSAVTHMDEADNPFLIPGVKVHTTPTSRFPISAVQLQRWHRGHWVPFGAVQTARP